MQTATNIVASERLFRLAIAAELVTVVGVLVLVWGLYVILRPIDRNVVWLATFFRLGENFVLALATLLELAILALAKGAVLSGQQPLLVNEVVRLYGDAFNIGFVFLGSGSTLFS